MGVEAKVKMPTRLGAMGVALLLIAGCGGGTGDTTSSTAPAATSTSAPVATTSTVPESMWFADHLSVGDCWNDTLNDGGGFDYSGIPELVDCSAPHDNEVFAAWTPEGDEYPGEEALDAAAEEACDPAYEAFVGIPWEEAGGLDYFWLWPDEEDWATGARGMACSVYLRNVEVMGSLEGVGRGARPFDFPEDAPIPDDALLIRAGLTEDGDDRLAAFDVETDPATTLEQILTLIEAAGWTVDASGGASRTVVIELSHEGAEYTITITAPEEEDELVSVAFYYPVD